MSQHVFQTCPLPWRDTGPPLAYGSVGPPVSRTDIDSAVFAQLTSITNTRTGIQTTLHPQQQAASMQAMRPNYQIAINTT